MTTDTRRKIVRNATLLVIIFAYGFSYSHGVAWALEHLPEDQPGREVYAYGLAAIPEVCFVMAVLRAQEDPKDRRVWVIGALSFAWMLWTNGASAAGGTSGMVVALLAPAAALLMLWVNGHPAPAQTEKATATRVTLERVTAERPVETQAQPIVTTQVVQDVPVVPAPVAQPTVKRTTVKREITSGSGDQLAAAVAWIKAQEDHQSKLPGRPAIVAGANVSDSTAKRARAVVRKELGA